MFLYKLIDRILIVFYEKVSKIFHQIIIYTLKREVEGLVLAISKITPIDCITKVILIVFEAIFKLDQ